MTLPPQKCRVYTPPPLATAMVQAIDDNPHDLWLDPCMGPGAFIASLRKQGVQKDRILGIDIDPRIGTEDISATTVRGVDFFTWCASTTRRFDRVVANPPYVAIRELHPTLQRPLGSHAAVRDKSFALRSNYWCAFLSASLKLLTTDASIAFVLPAAWDYAHYAADVRRTIHDAFEHVEVHRSCEPLFPDVREGCVVLIARGYRRIPVLSERLVHNDGPALVKALTTNRRRKPAKPSVVRKSHSTSFTRFSELYTVRIGSVTGDAKYFLLRESDRLRLELPRESLSPVLSKARHLTAAFMTATEWERLLKADERVWLFSPGADLVKNKAVQAYIRYGREACDLQAYKIRNREPWYRISDTRYGASAFLSGMTKLGPWISFRVKRQLIATNTLYVLTAKAKMNSDEQAAWALSLLSTNPRLQFQDIARRYPDGLAKLEPHDLNSLRLPSPVSSKGARETYAQAISLLVAGNIKEAVAIADARTGKS
jgi:adenine-specific DNA-methyltransferase